MIWYVLLCCDMYNRYVFLKPRRLEAPENVDWACDNGVDGYYIHGAALPSDNAVSAWPFLAQLARGDISGGSGSGVAAAMRVFRPELLREDQCVVPPDSHPRHSRPNDESS